jgi:SAM-dependent methyltransferase
MISTSQRQDTNGRVLHLGSGRAYKPGAVNVDVTSATHPDVVHDLNRTPWPFADSSFSELLAFDVIEHLDAPLRVAEEMHRVGEARAVVRLTVPHFSCDNAFTDPTHKHYFGWRTFDYFDDAHPNSFYSPARFRIMKRQLVFRPDRLVNKLVSRLANRFPQRYEERWCWIAPAWFLYIELEVVK